MISYMTSYFFDLIRKRKKGRVYYIIYDGIHVMVILCMISYRILGFMVPYMISYFILCMISYMLLDCLIAMSLAM